MTQDTSSKRLTLDDIRGLPTIPIWSETKPCLAAVFGVSRPHAYAMARAGQVPTIRMGGRIMIPVPALLRFLGEEPTQWAQPVTEWKPRNER